MNVCWRSDLVQDYSVQSTFKSNNNSAFDIVMQNKIPLCFGDVGKNCTQIDWFQKWSIFICNRRTYLVSVCVWFAYNNKHCFAAIADYKLSWFLQQQQKRFFFFGIKIGSKQALSGVSSSQFITWCDLIWNHQKTTTYPATCGLFWFLFKIVIPRPEWSHWTRRFCRLRLSEIYLMAIAKFHTILAFKMPTNCDR